jgi:hypothetical protein
MKMNRFTLNDSDTAQLEFGGQVQGKSYKIKILVVEDLPRISIEKNGEAVLHDTVKSVDDLKDISRRASLQIFWKRNFLLQE